MDSRADVFALGAVLAAILTGQPAFVGTTVKETVAKAASADLADVLTRLDGCGADAELIALAKRCLSADRNARPADGRTVASEVETYRAGVEARLRQAETDRAAAVVREGEQRKRRRVVVAFVSAVACFFAIGAAGVWWTYRLMDERKIAKDRQSALEQERRRDGERNEAIAQFDRLQSAFRDARIQLGGRIDKRDFNSRDLSALQKAVQEYGDLETPDWWERPLVTGLPDAQREKLRGVLSEVCYLLALNLTWSTDEAAAMSLWWNQLAETVNPEGCSHAVFAHRVDIFVQLGRHAEARSAEERALQIPLRTTREKVTLADRYLASNRHAEASSILAEAVRLDPTDFWAQYSRAICHARMSDHHEAWTGFTVAIALQPEVAMCYFNRALTAASLQKHAEAVSDLDAVLRLEPDFREARLHRSHALAGLGKTELAVADLDKVLAESDPGGLHVRARLQRAKLKKFAGDEAGHANDIAVGLTLTPADAIGWVMRGLARVDSDLDAALADIREAVRLEPQWTTALRNEAFVLHKLKRFREAVEVLSRLIPLQPNDIVLLCTRAYSYAHAGERDLAVADIDLALSKDSSVSVRWAAAGIFARLSDTDHKFKTRAISLLTELAKQNYSLGDLKADPDFASLRDDPEFRRIVDGK